MPLNGGAEGLAALAAVPPCKAVCRCGVKGFLKIVITRRIVAESVGEGPHPFAYALQVLPRILKRIPRPAGAHDGLIYGLYPNSRAAPDERRHHG